MAKDKISDYSASAASNTDIGGIGIQGTNAVSNFDGAFREIMSQLKEADNGTSPLTDTWSFCDPSDRTKIFRLDAGGISTATTRVLTVPNISSTIAVLGLAQTWTAIQTFSSGIGFGADDTITFNDTTNTYSVTTDGSEPGTIISTGKVRLVDTTDVTLASTAHAFQIGPTAGVNLAADGNEIQARNNGAAGSLLLNGEGGSVDVGSGGITSSGPITISGAAPTITLTDTDSNADSTIDANSAAGSLFISADVNGEAASSVMTFSVDGTEKTRYGDSYIQTWGGLSAVIDPTTGSTDGMSLSSAYRLVRSVDGYQPFQQRRRNSDGVIQEFLRGTALVGTISVTAAATAYNTSSDERLKTDFQPINPEILDSIKVYDFAWKADDSRSYGVKAQELEPIIPQAVYKGENPAEDMWSVDYSKLVPLLIAALQDARQRLSALEAAS